MAVCDSTPSSSGSTETEFWTFPRQQYQIIYACHEYRPEALGSTLWCAPIKCYILYRTGIRAVIERYISCRAAVEGWEAPRIQQASTVSSI